MHWGGSRGQTRAWLSFHPCWLPPTICIHHRNDVYFIFLWTFSWVVAEATSDTRRLCGRPTHKHTAHVLRRRQHSHTVVRWHTKVFELRSTSESSLTASQVSPEPGQMSDDARKLAKVRVELGWVCECVATQWMCGGEECWKSLKT